MLVVERKMCRSVTSGPRLGNASMVSLCISAFSFTTRLSVPASLVLCCLAGSHSVAQQLMPMYIPGQVCVNRTGGGMWCFSDKSNNELPAFSLGCSNTAFLEGKPICLPMEIDARMFEDQQAKLSDDLRRRAEELRSRLKEQR
jgi:hypothetical protein